MTSLPRPETTKSRNWELRLLTQPLYRYKSTDPDVLDGALFAFVTSAGTDPEALLVLEARKTGATNAPVWHYAVARFTDLNLWVRHKGKEVFSAPLVPYGVTPARSQEPVPRVQRPVTYRPSRESMAISQCSLGKK